MQASAKTEKPGLGCPFTYLDHASCWYVCRCMQFSPIGNAQFALLWAWTQASCFSANQSSFSHSFQNQCARSIQSLTWWKQKLICWSPCRRSRQTNYVYQEIQEDLKLQMMLNWTGRSLPTGKSELPYTMIVLYVFMCDPQILTTPCPHAVLVPRPGEGDLKTNQLFNELISTVIEWAECTMNDIRHPPHISIELRICLSAASSNSPKLHSAPCANT